MLDDGSGEGPSHVQGDEEQGNLEHPFEGDDVHNSATMESGPGQSSGAESVPENVVLTQDTESGGHNTDDIDRERVTIRNRKCSWAASKGVEIWARILDNTDFSEEEKRMVFHRWLSHERIRALDPEVSTAVQKVRSVATTLGQSLRGALQTIRSTCIEGKSKVRNIVLTAAVSRGDSQRKICKALGAS